jgi:division protein CdvB (Snf7/Vps24/ESCRT-III family)
MHACMYACMQIRHSLRSQAQEAAPQCIKDLNQKALSETVQKINDAFNDVKVPVATEQQVIENLDLMGLPVAMHDALAAQGAVDESMHDVGAEALMQLSHSSSSAPQISGMKFMCRLVRLRSSLFS